MTAAVKQFHHEIDIVVVNDKTRELLLHKLKSIPYSSLYSVTVDESLTPQKTFPRIIIDSDSYAGLESAIDMLKGIAASMRDLDLR